MKARELRVGMLVYLPATADGREEIKCAELTYKGRATGANQGLLELFWEWHKQTIYPQRCEEFVDPEMEIGEMVCHTPSLPLGPDRELLLLLMDGYSDDTGATPLDLDTLRRRSRGDWGANHRFMIDRLRKRGLIENKNREGKAMWALTKAGRRILDA